MLLRPFVMTSKMSPSRSLLTRSSSMNDGIGTGKRAPTVPLAFLALPPRPRGRGRPSSRSRTARGRGHDRGRRRHGVVDVFSRGVLEDGELLLAADRGGRRFERLGAVSILEAVRDRALGGLRIARWSGKEVVRPTGPCSWPGSPCPGPGAPAARSRCRRDSRWPSGP